MNKNIYLLRHAQSEYNEKGIFQGRLDSDLTPLGFVQARLSAQEFLGKEIEVIYSSPQRRAYKTALTIADLLGLEVIVDERIREMSFGNYEGKKFWDLVEEEGHIFRAWLSNPVRNPLPTQENMEDFSKRVKSFLEDVINGPYKNLLVVAHGGTLHAMATAFFAWSCPTIYLSSSSTILFGVNSSSRSERDFVIVYLLPFHSFCF